MSPNCAALPGDAAPLVVTTTAATHADRRDLGSAVAILAEQLGAGEQRSGKGGSEEGGIL